MIVIKKDSENVVKTDVEGLSAPLLLLVLKSKETNKITKHKVNVDIDLRFCTFKINESKENEIDLTNEDLRLLNTTYIYWMYQADEDFNEHSEVLKTGMLKKI